MAQLCKKCDTYLPEEDFSPSFRGKQGKYCYNCHLTYNRERYTGRSNKPGTAATRAVRLRLSPERAFKHTIGVWCKDKVEKERIWQLYLDHLRAQGLNCEVCGRQSSHGKGPGLVVDHDHATNTFRGFLCSSCNKALGLVDDDPCILVNLIRYLEVSNASERGIDKA